MRRRFPTFAPTFLALFLGAGVVAGQGGPGDVHGAEKPHAAPSEGFAWKLAGHTPFALGMQVVNPAEAQKKPEKEKTGSVPPAKEGGHPHTWEMPPVTVAGRPPAELREEQLVGSYAQPRWTTARRFPTTRVYVRPEGRVEFEYWLIPKINKHGPTDVRSLYEAEFGLPHRLQLDLYLRSDKAGNDGERFVGEQVELRYAFADWGEIPGNPTLYLEWGDLEQGPDVIEPKLLFGGELAPRWHWGVNLAAELETGGERAYEYSATSGLSYTVLDEEFSVGVEGVIALTDFHGDRGNLDESMTLGPSLQWHPSPPMTINLAPLFGVTGPSPAARIYVNVGWEF